MKWNGIVNPRPDVRVLEEIDQAIAVCRSNHIQVIHGTRPRWFEWRLDPIGLREQAVVLSGSSAPLSVPPFQVRQFRVKYASLNRVQPSVISLHRVIVLLHLPMISEHPDLFQYLCVIGGHRTAFTA